MEDKKIGEINAEKKIEGKSAEYSMSSTVEATMMFKVQVSSVTKTYWYNDMLTISRATRTSNMPGQDQTTALQLKGKNYEVTKNDAQSQASYPIKLCVTNLYFQEPVKDTAAFSEIQAIYLPIKTLGNHRYQITQPNGKSDIYSYINGKLQKIESLIVGKNVTFIVQ